MQPNFDKALKYVLFDEGGNDDDPNDHGGRTSRGVTQREYDAYCRNHSLPVGDVWHATNEQVKDIYHKQYWNPYCDALPSGLDYLFFDISVNCGRTQAVRQFQKALNVNVDGMFGQVTIDQITQQGTPDGSDLIKRISEVRRGFYRHLNQYPRFGKGWIKRVDNGEGRALAMVNNEEHTSVPAPAPKSDNVPAGSAIPPQATGGATATLLAILNQFKEDLQNLTSYIPDLNYVLFGIAVIGFGYMGWGFYKQYKTNKAI